MTKSSISAGSSSRSANTVTIDLMTTQLTPGCGGLHLISIAAVICTGNSSKKEAKPRSPTDSLILLLSLLQHDICFKSESTSKSLNKRLLVLSNIRITIVVVATIKSFPTVLPSPLIISLPLIPSV